MKQIAANIKYILSFFKRNWSFSDYPLETWTIYSAEQNDCRYGASLINWSFMTDNGSSLNEAIENLKLKFLEYSRENDLPRPGSKVPIKFADTDLVDSYENIAVEFFDRILGLNYYECFVSNMSSLWDFTEDIDKVTCIIKEEYGIEVQEDFILADIFKQIHNTK